MQVDPRIALLSTILASVVERLDAAFEEEVDPIWSQARAALEVSEGEEAAVAQVIENRDVEGLRTLVKQWASGERILPHQDLAVLRRAMKAYKKRLKLTRLDDESRIGGRAMSAGRTSGIVAIAAPHQYPNEVWETLVRLGRLVRRAGEMYELPPS